MNRTPLFICLPLISMLMLIPQKAQAQNVCPALVVATTAGLACGTATYVVTKEAFAPLYKEWTSLPNQVKIKLRKLFAKDNELELDEIKKEMAELIKYVGIPCLSILVGLSVFNVTTFALITAG
jgi:hypothetical protein